MAFPLETAFEYLQRAAQSGRLGHAYLIQGPRGAGKRELAERLAAYLNESTLQGRAIADHPDFHVVRPESKSRQIRIEQMRGLEQDLHRFANVGPMKIGVIETADRITNQAANSFLKTLEEPPENSLLLLLTEAPEMLLDTIRSRCISVYLQAQDAPELSPLEKTVLRLAAQSSQQHVRGVAAAFLMTNEFRDLLAEVRGEILDEHKGLLDEDKEHYRDTTDSAKVFLEQREDQLKALTESRYILRRNELVALLVQWWVDVLKLHEDPEARVTFADHAEQTRDLAGRLAFPEIFRRLKALEQLQDHLNYNVQEALAIESAFLKAFA